MQSKNSLIKGIKKTISIPFIFFISCNEEEAIPLQKESQSSGESNKTLISDEDLKKRILLGDTAAYNDLSSRSFNFYEANDQIFFYSLVMADVYDYGKAYEDVAFAVKTAYFHFHVGLDTTMINFRKRYLLKAAEHGSSSAWNELEEFNEPDSL